MRKNIISSIFVFLVITGVLIPLYSYISAYGVIIAVGLGSLGSICIYRYYGILDEEKKNMLNKIEDINNKMDQAMKQMNRFQEENRDNQEKLNEEFAKRIEQESRELLEIKDKTHQNLMKINQVVENSNEFNKVFFKTWSDKLDQYLTLLNSGQEKLRENMDKSVKGIKEFCTEINDIIKSENQRNNDILSNIFDENKQHMKLVVTRIEQVMEETKLLLVDRIGEDLESLNQIKKDTAENLEKISGIFENNEKFNKEYLENLDKNIMECFVLYNSGQKKFYEQTRSQIDSIKSSFDEMIEDLEDNQEDILKAQSKNVNAILTEMRDLVMDINNNIESQSEKHEEEVRAIKRLQDEILNLNQKDIELIKVMLDENEI